MKQRWQRLFAWLKGHWPRRLAAIASGLLVALAFPHFDIWPLAWFALVPVLVAAHGLPFRKSFRLALLAGTTANFVGFFWMVNMLHRFGHLPYAPSVLIIFVGSAYQGLSIAASVSLADWLNRRRHWPIALTLPIVYTGLEAFHPILFPWFLGNCQHPLLYLIQVCDIGGISALTFLVVAANGVLFKLLLDARSGRLKTHRKSALAGPALLVLVLIALVGYGAVRVGQFRARTAEAEQLRVGVVEPEIDIFEAQMATFPKGTSPLDILKWNLLELHRTSRELAQQKPDLLIWPESTYFPALSVYARQWRSRWLAGGRHLTRVGVDGPLDTPAALRQVALGGASGGEHLTFLVGSGGTVWKAGDTSLVEEDSGVDADLHDAWVSCQASVELKDTSADQCFVIAVGDRGTILVRSPKGWVRLEADEPEDWRVVAGSGLTDLLVGSDERLGAGSVTEGLTLVQPTPKDRWVAGVRLDDAAALVSQRGTIARLSATRAIQLQSPRKPVPGTVRDAATDGKGRLLLATSKGLYIRTDTALQPLWEGVQVRRVACAGPGECLAVSDDHLARLVNTDSGDFRPLDLGQENPATLVGIPFSRHYWWLPADATAVYQSADGLPLPHQFPTAVTNDTGTAVADRNAVQRAFSTPLLFGATSGTLHDIEHPNSLENARYNSAFLINEQGTVLGRYDKQYLLAFGEYIPMGDLFPALYEMSPDSGRFSPGPARSPIMFKGHRLGILICYEDIIPSHTNAVVDEGVDVLLNLTNDAWFGKTKEPYQHFVLASYRAIEQRRAMVRATTTGISGVIAPTGEVSHMTDLHGAEAFVADVPLLQGRTLYRMGGRFFPHVCLLLTLLGLAWAMFRPRQ